MKPKLRAQLVPTYRVRAADFEQYVATVYGIRNYDFAADVGCQAGEVVEYTVTGNVPATAGFAEKLADVRRGRVPRRYPDVMLAALVLDGYIPRGKYAIDTTPEKPLVLQYTELLQKYAGPTAPECVRFVGQHLKDRAFIKRARFLNEAWGVSG